MAQVILSTGTAPATPAAGNVTVYTKTSDKKLYFKDDAGLETGPIGAAQTSIDALNSATTVVNVGAATAPTAGQVLTATSPTTATWQTASGVSANQAAVVCQMSHIFNGGL